MMITIARLLQAESRCDILCNSKSSVSPSLNIQNIVVHARVENNDCKYYSRII